MDKLKNKNRHYLSELLYYNLADRKTSELKKSLLEYKFLLCTSLETLTHLETGSYEKFDGLVGENACQIRAIKVAFLAFKKKDEEILKRRLQIKKIISRVDSLLVCSNLNRLMHDKISLKDLIENEYLDIIFNCDEIFLIQSFLLSEMKECWPDSEFTPSILRKERCSPSAIQKKHSQVSYSFVKKLAKNLRIDLAKRSVDFIRQLASKLNRPELKKMVGKEFEFSHNKLPCLPTFWTFKILFAHLQKKGTPIIFHVRFLSQVENGYRIVDEEFVYLKPCSESKNYIEVDPENKNLRKPALVIQGAITTDQLPTKEEWKTKIQKFCPMDIIFSIAADHRQYPDPNRIINVPDPEYRRYKLMALKEGFSLTNPQTFFAQHIYCTQPIKILDLQPDNLIFTS